MLIIQNKFISNKNYLISLSKNNSSKSHSGAFNTLKKPAKTKCMTNSIGYAKILYFRWSQLSHKLHQWG